MDQKKHILLLTTGGTIASVPGGDGLQPADAGIFQREMDQLRTYYDITVRDVTVYCDDVIAAKYGTKAVTVYVENQIQINLLI